MDFTLGWLSLVLDLSIVSKIDFHTQDLEPDCSFFADIPLPVFYVYNPSQIENVFSCSTFYCPIFGHIISNHRCRRNRCVCTQLRVNDNCTNYYLTDGKLIKRMTH
jgi:hypothetical protein